MWLLTVFLTVLIILFINFVWKIIDIYSFWSRKGVPSVNFIYSFENYYTNIFRRCPTFDVIQRIYNANKEKRYYGMYNFLDPVLLVTDPDLIRRITSTEFETFPNHTEYSRKEVDSFFSKNIYSLKYAEGWSTLKTILGPFFTSSKLRLWLPIMQSHADDFVEYLETQGDTVTIESMEIFLRLSVDVIGDAAMGVRYNSFKDPNNYFWMVGTEVNRISAFSFWAYLLDRLAPYVLQNLGVKILSSKCVDMIRALLKRIIQFRKEQNIVRPDFIGLLTTANDSNRRRPSSMVTQELEITDDFIASQLCLFTFGAAPTVSSAMRVLCYELANHPEIQKKVADEIGNFVNGDSEVSYEAIQSMKYLDKVISEALRRNPLTGMLERQSVKPYVVKAEREGEKDVYLEKGTSVWMPYSLIHLDERYYPNPKKFDPERFDDPNVKNLFFSFGWGSRKCIGERFGLLEMKVITVKLLQKYEILPADEEHKDKIMISASNLFKTKLKRKV